MDTITTAKRHRDWRENNPPCTVEGCTKPQEILKDGLCNAHLLRLKRYGRLEYGVPSGTLRRHKGPWFDEFGNRKECLIGQCTKPVSAAGLCNSHYHRKLRYGDPLYDPLATKRRICAMGKCRNMTTASHQMCVIHASSIYSGRIKGTIPRIAREAVGNALKYGKLQKKPCQECGSLHKVEAHHEDYEKPLEVIWLCKKHHTLLHLSRRHSGIIRSSTPLNSVIIT